jgi:hypothetical protein
MNNNMNTSITGLYDDNTITITSDSIFPTSSINTGTITDWSHSVMNPSPSGKLVLSGADADVVIDGVSLKDTLVGIQQRLAIIQLNPELEDQWQSLRALGDQYRALEAELLEKQKMWEAVKQ